MGIHSRVGGESGIEPLLAFSISVPKDEFGVVQAQPGK
jgi:hypothetical protein